MALRIGWLIVTGVILTTLLSVLGLAALTGTPKPIAVTENSYKYIDDRGNICFAPSKNAVPERYRGAKHMSHALDWEAAPSQTISFRDIDGDGEKEILVEFKIQYPAGHINRTLEVIKRAGLQFIKLATVHAERGDNVRFYHLAEDPRAEIYGPIWGMAPEFWVWDDGHYENIMPKGVVSIPLQGKDDTVEAALKRLIKQRRG
jgi:hypothetical protein